MSPPASPTIAVIGLGYVGLPLVAAFGVKFRTIGFDIAQEKVLSCQNGSDPSRELTAKAMAGAIYAEYTSDAQRLGNADYIIIAVLTPVDKAHIPDFSALIDASASAGRHMKRGCTIIYESTVYPGATEEICIPILEQNSGLRWKMDFYVAYSPERINPGDREHTLTNVLKVVSGDTPDTLERVAKLYESIVTAGVHRCSSIKIAEAAKVNARKNCADIHNTKVMDMVRELESYGINVSIHDPFAICEETRKEFGVQLLSWKELPTARAMIITVAHKPLIEPGFEQIRSKLSEPACIMDIKGILPPPPSLANSNGICYWRL